MNKNKLSILHLTYDYSEENIGNSTVVIKDLINGSSNYFNCKVISLSRNFSSKKISLDIVNSSFIRIVHMGFPYGLFLKFISKKIAHYIYNNCYHLIGLDTVKAIHAHKLTFEGFIGFELAKFLNKPLIISIRQTDFYVLKYRPDLINFTKKILDYSSVVFYIAPYMINRLKKIWGEKYIDSISNKLIYLPNPVSFELNVVDDKEIEDYYTTILWLTKKSVRRKNLFGLLKAIKLLNNPSLKLKIVGKGEYGSTVSKWVKELKLENNVEIVGFIPNNKINEILARSRGLLLPSFSETFGVVYAEALLCGVPILYSKDTGFDGVFDQVGIAVNPTSIKSIADGITFLDQNYVSLRKNIHKLMQDGVFNIFNKEIISLTYYQTLMNYFD